MDDAKTFPVSNMLDRRAFLRRALVASGGLAGASLLAACGGSSQSAPTTAPVAATTVAATGAPSVATRPAGSASTGATVPAAAGAPKRGGKYTFGTGQGITTLDPHKTSLLNDQNAFAGLWSGLVVMNEDMEPQPSLAEKWDVVDPITYLFHLRKGVKFHNGREVTADDVKFSLDRVADPATASQLRGQSLPLYDHAEVVDPLTVKLINKSPFGPQIDALAKVMIIAKENLTDIGNKPIGTGPFQFGEFVQDDRLVMKRFPDYWNKDNVYLDQVVIKTIKDATALVQALKSGDVDSIWQLSTPKAQEVQSDPKLTIYRPKKNAIVQMLMLDNNQPPFNDPRARQALSYATDRKSINDVAFFGQFIPHDYDIPMPTDNWAFDKSLPKATFDLQKAKELFDAAGVKSGTKITYQAISTANPEWVTTGEILQQSLGKIGITVEIEKLDLSAWAAIFNPPTDKIWPARIISNGNTGYSDPFFFFVTAQPGGRNFNHYGNKEAQGLLDKAASSVDRNQRMSLYAQVQQLMAKDVMCPTPYVQVGLYGVTKALKGFYAQADWVPHYESAWLDR